MLISVTFSKPTKIVEQSLGKNYKKIKIILNSSSIAKQYFAQFFTDTQVFHKTFSLDELNSFIEQNAGITFKSCIQKFTDKEISLLANKKGKITKLEKKLSSENLSDNSSELKYFSKTQATNNRQKNYILKEGYPVPFLITLGVMTPEGKIINSKYDKFKQINRYLEYINDILPSVLQLKKDESHPLQIVDFGCGKSYLTFAIHYFLTEIKKIDCNIIGLDLKEDVISYCNKLTKDFNLKGIVFKTGDISEYSNSKQKYDPDIVITLHACDTATDFALQYAISKNAKAILCVPCCQHEVNQQLNKNKKENLIPKEISSLFKYGLIQERVASLITDSLRAEFLEHSGYKVDVMEFIDINHTPKNILLRALKKNSSAVNNVKPGLIDFINISPFIWNQIDV